MDNNLGSPARAGTAGGIVFVLLQIHPDEICKTLVLASLGATVSFIVSMGLKYLIKRIRRH